MFSRIRRFRLIPSRRVWRVLLAELLIIAAAGVWFG
jgi:hypothetical protein